MPRVYRTKKERECLLIREFVEHLGYTVSSPKWQERPDALLTLRNARGTKRVAIELTDHYTDTIAGQRSPLTPIGDFWRIVETSIMRRISHRPHLTGLLGTMSFKSNPALPAGQGRALRIATQDKARKLAAEIIDFAEDPPIVTQSGWHIFRRRDFTAYPTMEGLLEFFRLSRVADEYVGASRCNWNCSNINAGHIAVSMHYIKSAIAAKNKKASGYENWGKTEEKWLLIAAGGGNVNTHAPRFEPSTKWSDPILQTLCSASLFDRIVFWERVGRWCKWLK